MESPDTPTLVSTQPVIHREDEEDEEDNQPTKNTIKHSNSNKPTPLKNEENQLDSTLPVAHLDEEGEEDGLTNTTRKTKKAEEEEEKNDSLQVTPLRSSKNRSLTLQPNSGEERELQNTLARVF